MTSLRQRVYIFLCKDGVWRQRCGRHIEEQGPYAPVNAYNRWESNGQCVICDHERGQGDGGGDGGTGATIQNPHAV